MPAILRYTCAIYQQIKDPLVKLVPHARTPQLHMCNMSSDRVIP